jgi:hypothetical protein
MALAVVVMDRNGLRKQPATNHPPPSERGNRTTSANAEPTRS